MKSKFLISIFIIYILLFNNAFAEILFSEILPNTDDDTNLEYIELFNSGDLEQSLSGFILKDKSEKEFVFGIEEKLLSGEKKKYFRSETKILLNNSNEELYLYNEGGILVDNYSYVSTVKNEKIIIIEDNANNVENNPPLTPPSNQGGEDIFVPEVKFSFQSPTYLLEKDQTISIYNCDRTKDVCKINLDLRDSFLGDYSESDYECISDFSFITGEENKCNPSSFIVPLGNYTFNIKIKDKNNEENFTEKQFQIINKGYLEDSEEESYDHLKKKKKKNTGAPPVIISKPNIIVEGGLNSDNKCSNKNNCNINFKYAEKSKFEKCDWDFGEGIFEAGINTKCNPSYVEYGTGKYLVKLRVFEKGNYFNYKESVIRFGEEKEIKNYIDNEKEEKNDEKIINTPILNSFPLQEKEATVEKDKIKSVITLQGKIGKNKTINGNILTCYETCSINFDGSFSSGKIKRYSWDFGNGNRYEGKNPGYIKYETPGNYKIYLLSEGEEGSMDIGEFYVNFIDSNQENNEDEISILGNVYADDEPQPLTGILSPYQEKEATKNNDQIIILLYILIGIFGGIFIVLILKKEKLL